MRLRAFPCRTVSPPHHHHLPINFTYGKTSLLIYSGHQTPIRNTLSERNVRGTKKKKKRYAINIIIISIRWRRVFDFHYFSFATAVFLRSIVFFEDAVSYSVVERYYLMLRNVFRSFLGTFRPTLGMRKDVVGKQNVSIRKTDDIFRVSIRKTNHKEASFQFFLRGVLQTRVRITNKYFYLRQNFRVRNFEMYI